MRGKVNRTELLRLSGLSRILSLGIVVGEHETPCAERAHKDEAEEHLEEMTDVHAHSIPETAAARDG